MKCPYDDENMVYDEILNQYVLTPAAILDYYGIDLVSEAKSDSYGDKAINAIMKMISTHCYNYIHQFTVHNKMQDMFIATTEEGRKLIYRAMLEQFSHVKKYGDLSANPDESKRKMWFSPQAAAILNKPLSIGVPITYSGV